ncbi:MAG: 1-acyl-sn-glycerol-3-phosphate acyltransferase [Leptospiraceae bacterium]|nr:1-acyl-sn-glycerol-3-phosphate acyltransferase [Leptospiraceae bacterium]
MKQTRLGKGASRPITKYDEILNFFMTPADIPIRKLWELAKEYKVDRKITLSFLDVIIPIYHQMFKSLYNLKVTGIEKIPLGKRCIISPNHSSWLDAQLIASILPQRAYFLAKKELLKMPVSGVMMELVGGVGIDREYVDASGLKKAMGLLKKNEHLVVFPEGTIPGEEDLSVNDMEPETGLLPGNTGAVVLAIKTQAPIFPVGIIGANEVLPPETFPRLESLPDFKNTQLIVNIGEPITYEKYYNKKISAEETEELTRELMKQIGKLAGKKQSASQKKI